MYIYIYIYIAGTGSCVHEPIHHIFRSFVGQHRKMGCCPPATIQMVHTHTLPQQGLFGRPQAVVALMPYVGGEVGSADSDWKVGGNE